MKGFFAGSRVASKAPAPTIPQCGACGLLKRCHSPKMPVSGEGRRGILVVGEAPGETEDRQGTQFVGKTGAHLRRVMRKVGIDLDQDCWKTNAIICRPPSNRTPTPNEIDYCRPNLNNTIKELQPKVIIPLGGAAVRAVIGPMWKSDVGSIGRWVGWKIPSQQANAWVLPTWHPSYVVRMDDHPVINKFFEGHLRRAAKIKRRPWQTVPNWEGDVKIIYEPDKAARWLDNCVQHGGGGVVAFDYETNMLKPDGPDARIVSASVAWGREEPEKTIAFPWAGAAVPAFKRLVASPIPKVAANMKFEDRWTRAAFGHRVRNWYWDTMVAAHVMDNRPDITGLKFQSFVLLGMPSFNDHIEPFLKSKGDTNVNRILKEVDLRDLLLYNGLDSLLEFRVAMRQMKMMKYPLPTETS